jgi:hypothetical protein
MSAAVMEAILDEFDEPVPFKHRPMQEYQGNVRQQTDLSQMSSQLEYGISGIS